LIAIKAPHGTTLEVPDPDEVIPKVVNSGKKLQCLCVYVPCYSFSFPQQAVDYPQRRYRIVFRSTMGPIDVYLVR
jgi:transcription factor E2F3